MTKLYVDSDKYGDRSQSAVVDAFHNAVKEIIRRTLDECGGDWRSLGHQPLRELSAMAYAVLVAAQTRFLGSDFADALVQLLS